MKDQQGTNLFVIADRNFSSPGTTRRGGGVPRSWPSQHQLLQEEHEEEEQLDECQMIGDPCEQLVCRIIDEVLELLLLVDDEEEDNEEDGEDEQ
jgi:hypothetical protein